MHPLIKQLAAGGPVITDGAWGTELQARGLQSGDVPDAWNLSHPDKVAEVARAYVDAGSRIILTNTFGANRLRMAETGCLESLVQINQRGVEISRQAAAAAPGSRALVFASVGPSGKILMNAETTEEELLAAFTEQAKALASGGADGLVIETMGDIAEAVLAVQACKSTGLPVVACMVYDSGKALDRTMMGVTPEQAARALTDAGADVVGANCGQGIDGFVALCKRLHAATPLPIWIKANAGLPTMEAGRAVYHTTPAQFAERAAEIIQAGASFIGGCCGTNPSFIQALRAAFAP